MTSKLIIIRGNSGSGKTTIAKGVCAKIPSSTLLQQDVIRREILHVEDTIGNPSIDLISQMALFGKNHTDVVVIEGILAKEKYGDMLSKLITQFDETHVYYLHVSFQETLARHQTRVEQAQFGEEEMKKWWREDDLLGVKNEKSIDHSFSANEMIDTIIKDLK
jgi:adenylate kinase family enzyme